MALSTERWARSPFFCCTCPRKDQGEEFASPLVYEYRITLEGCLDGSSPDRRISSAMRAGGRLVGSSPDGSKTEDVDMMLTATHEVALEAIK